MKNICVVGIGGIGGYVAGRLSTAPRIRHGTNLSLVARGAHLEAIRENGLVFKPASGEDILCRPSAATDRPADLPIQDLVLLCVKGYGLTEACEGLKPAVGPETAVLPLLNGIDIYDRVKKLLPGAVVLPGCIYISSALKEPGTVAQSGGKGNIVAGFDPARRDYDPLPLTEIMEEAGIPFEWKDDPLNALWTKYIFIASYGLVTAVSGKTIGGVLADPGLRALMQGVLGEISALAAAKGAGLPPNAVEDVFMKGAAFPFDTKTSFQRDVEIPGRPNEGELFGGTIVRMGRELGIPTPVSEDLDKKIRMKK